MSETRQGPAVAGGEILLVRLPSAVARPMRRALKSHGLGCRFSSTAEEIAGIPPDSLSGIVISAPDLDDSVLDTLQGRLDSAALARPLPVFLLGRLSPETCGGEDRALDRLSTLGRVLPIDASAAPKDHAKRVAGAVTKANRDAATLSESVALPQALSYPSPLFELIPDRTALLEILSGVASIANEAMSFRRALLGCITLLGKRMGWTLIHAYLRDPNDPDVLVSSRISWSANPRRVRGFLQSTRQLQFRPGEGIVGRAAELGEPVWVDDIGEDKGFRRSRFAREIPLRTVVACPVLAGRQTVGVIEFYSDKRLRKSKVVIEALSSLTVHLTHVYQRKEWEAQLSEAIWAGQRRAGQEIHDGLGQQLTAIGLIAGSLARDLKRRKDKAAERARKLVAAVQDAKRHSRALMKGLMPVEVGADGLRSALEDLAGGVREGGEIDCELVCLGEISLQDSYTATHLFRIAQEAVNNAVKHSGATRILIELKEITLGEVILSVEDNGRGMDLESMSATSEGMGMRILRRRAELIDARLDIYSRPEEGTHVECLLRPQLQPEPPTIPGF